MCSVFKNRKNPAAKENYPSAPIQQSAYCGEWGQWRSINTAYIRQLPWYQDKKTQHSEEVRNKLKKISEIKSLNNTKLAQCHKQLSEFGKDAKYWSSSVSNNETQTIKIIRQFIQI